MAVEISRKLHWSRRILLGFVRPGRPRQVQLENGHTADSNKNCGTGAAVSKAITVLFPALRRFVCCLSPIRTCPLVGETTDVGRCRGDNHVTRRLASFKWPESVTLLKCNEMGSKPDVVRRWTCCSLAIEVVFWKFRTGGLKHVLLEGSSVAYRASMNKGVMDRFSGHTYTCCRRRESRRWTFRVCRLHESLDQLTDRRK